MKRIIIGFFLFFPLSVLADATLSVSPSTWSFGTDILTWTVAGTPNASDYGECFQPSGTRIQRVCPGVPDTLCMQAATTSPESINSACNGVVSGTGTIHVVGVNVDSGSGFAGWSTNCDQVGSTYSGCSAYLLGDSRAGYFDQSITYAGAPLFPTTWGFWWW